ncbi:MAG: hypothetical protein J7K87_04185 [Candidatus Aenigmarchaeota archaeon]|nr:hypothetical protein [Candidatus Aenigmarchaeota archaeon]
MKKVIFIGGAPTTGKSYIAKKLSEELKLPWISTDTIRELMRRLVKKEDYPALFYLSEATPEKAVEFLTGNTPEDIVKIQNEESLDVWKGVKALIETDYVWESFIVEGVALLPHVISKFIRENKNIDAKAVFLVRDDVEHIRKVIFTRGLWDDAEKYPDSIKEKEVAWVIAFNNFIKSETKKYNLPTINVDYKNYLEEVKRMIK